MKIENIHESWGSKIEFENPKDFFNKDFSFWRSLIYDRKLLVFKKMNFSIEDYALFCSQFGNMWNKTDYAYSHEKTETVTTPIGDLVLSPFNNINSPRLNTQPMPWHADIPNKKENPFPFRSLWITQNPNPEISGITGFLNINLPLTGISEELLQLIPRVKIIQQSWYKVAGREHTPLQDLQEFDFIKEHPVTKEKSLRLNFFNIPGVYKDAWICNVKIDDTLQPDCSLVGTYIEELLKISNRIYYHTWDTFDIAIYDNWSFVHNRSKLILNSGEIRNFYRANIDLVI